MKTVAQNFEGFITSTMEGLQANGLPADREEIEKTFKSTFYLAFMQALRTLEEGAQDCDTEEAYGACIDMLWDELSLYFEGAEDVEVLEEGKAH